MDDRLTNMIKAVSLECLSRETVADTPHNQALFKELERLDEEYKSSSCRITILARVYEICLMMDFVTY